MRHWKVLFDAAQGMQGPTADAQAQAQGQSALFEKLAMAAAAQNPGGLSTALPSMPKGSARTLDDIEAALKGGTFNLAQGSALHGFGPQPGGPNPGNALLSMLQANANVRSSPQPAQVMLLPGSGRYCKDRCLPLPAELIRRV